MQATDFERVAERIGKTLRSLPDREATEDRRAAIDSMRRMNGVPAPRSAPSYSCMTDREFAESVQSELGFTPKLDTWGG